MRLETQVIVLDGAHSELPGLGCHLRGLSTARPGAENPFSAPCAPAKAFVNDALTQKALYTHTHYIYISKYMYNLLLIYIYWIY